LSRRFSLFHSQFSNRRFQFNKSRQLFIRTHNEALIVATVRVNNEDSSPLEIRG
jgi:hypothetical protein